jgi:hypothetical protein
MTSNDAPLSVGLYAAESERFAGCKTGQWTQRGTYTTMGKQFWHNMQDVGIEY